MNQAPSLSSCIFYSIIRRLCEFCFISPLHMLHSPPGVFLFRTVHLASLPFLSPRCVPPALLRSAVFVTSAVHICWLSLSTTPAPGPSSVPSLRSSVFARGAISQPEKEQFCYGRCSCFHAVGSSPLIKGKPCCSHSTADCSKGKDSSAAA